MICYGVPDIPNRKQWAQLGIPFEYQDFMDPNLLDREEEIAHRIADYRSLPRDRQKDIVHGPFLDICVHSSDSTIRAASDKRIRQVCDIAVALGARAIILHTNLISNFYAAAYRQGWVDRNEVYLKALLEDYPALAVYMENMFDEEPDCLLALARRMEGQRFGICLDVAHAHISNTDISQWLALCGPYIAHYHFNDNHGKLDEHLAVGNGNIPWEQVLPKLRPGASVLLEVDSLDKYRLSAAALEQRGMGNRNESQ